MDIKQIKDSLNKIFNEENKRIIFWYDAEKEFEETIPSIEIDGVNILHLNEIGSLEVKIRPQRGRLWKPLEGDTMPCPQRGQG